MFAQLCIADGVEAVSAIARNTSISLRQDSTSGKNPLGDLPSTKSSHTSVGGEVTSKVLLAEVARPPLHAYEIYGHSGGSSNMQEKLHILIIDADSEDPRWALCLANRSRWKTS